MQSAVPRCQRFWRLSSLPVSFSSRQFHLLLHTRRLPCLARPRQSPRATVSFSTQSIPTIMESAVFETVERIHSSPFKLVMYVTGGAAHVRVWSLFVQFAKKFFLFIFASPSCSRSLSNPFFPSGSIMASFCAWSITYSS